MILEIAQKARKASLELAVASTEQKNRALRAIAKNLRAAAAEILAENKLDVEKAASGGLSKPMLERLALSGEKIESIAKGVEAVIDLPDPVGVVLEKTTRPNGLEISKVSTPIGVIAIIYESRPNVTIDCAVLCLKSGNAAILRGGSEAFKTNMALASVISKSLAESGLNPDCVQIIPTSDRAALGELLTMRQYVNCVIPRGGEGLIKFVVETSTIPVIKHYKGVCTVYLDKFADEKMSDILAIDSKCQRPSVCNAAENLIVHKDCAQRLLPEVASKLAQRGVELRASACAKDILDKAGIPCKEATAEDFQTEYTDLIISIDVVDSLQQAIDFINTNGSGHSDLIVTNDAGRAQEFQNKVDSSTVYWNASTRFTDGYEFGLGAEIGISTDKLHARGPMGLRELCSYKYKVCGCGQTRGKPAL